jgi:hypothetical protein
MLHCASDEVGWGMTKEDASGVGTPFRATVRREAHRSVPTTAAKAEALVTPSF